MQSDPQFRKCCGCVPLGVCLQIWAWIKLITDVLLSVICLYVLFLIFVVGRAFAPHREPVIDAYVGLLFLIFLVADFCFTVTLIIGLGRDKLTLLDSFFRYGKFMICIEVIFLITTEILAATKKTRNWGFIIIFSVASIVWIGIDIYMMLTLKSEIVKLQNKEFGILNTITQQPLSNPVYVNTTIEHNNEEKTFINQPQYQQDKYESCN